MKYCYECGAKLTMKECGEEGLVPFCPSCNVFRFPIFSTAISAVVLNPDKNKVLLIQQYGRKDNILLAGYINKGEDAEHALIREAQEEVGINIIQYQYMRSRYFEKSNTLMCNFVGAADSEILHISSEVDKAAWFSFDEAKSSIMPDSLAQKFLDAALRRIQNETVKYI